MHSLRRKDSIDIKVYTFSKNIPYEKILIFEKQGGGEVGSNIRSITSNYPPPSDNFFQKTRGGVVGEFFPSSKLLAWGEVEITPTKSAPAAGI